MDQYRNELKFICTDAELRMIEERIRCVMQTDQNSGNDGYAIRSVYFDDYQNSCMEENEAGTYRRSKFRIRIYDGDTQYIRLEEKIKKDGLGKKETCILTEDQCNCFLKREIQHIGAEDPAVMRKLKLEMMLYGMHPVNIVAYDRKAYVYKAGNVRITFDRNISMSTDVSAFLDSMIPLTPIMPRGYHVLEVKYDDFLPDFIAGLLEIGTLERTSFSKYYLSRAAEIY